jgi:hypothetical protein
MALGHGTNRQREAEPTFEKLRPVSKPIAVLVSTPYLLVSDLREVLVAAYAEVRDRMQSKSFPFLAQKRH